MSRFKTTSVLLPLSAALILALGFGSVGFAQQGLQVQPDAGFQSPFEFPMEPFEARYQELVVQLQEIERDTILNRPDLQSEFAQLQQGAIETMEQMGHDPQGVLQRMNEIGRELEATEVDTPEQEDLLRDFEAQRMQLAMAEQDALEDAELQRAHSEFQENLLQAQRERHPQFDTLLVELLELQQEIQGDTGEGLPLPR